MVPCIELSCGAFFLMPDFPDELHRVATTRARRVQNQNPQHVSNVVFGRGGIQIIVPS
jgi:hypothetical protein